jgi:hypothetical protein
MTVRCVLALSVLSSVVGCGSTRPESRSGPSQLLAYSRPASDLGVERPTIEIAVERIPEQVLRDPTRVLSLRLFLARQLEFRTREVPEERYQRLVRPHLAHQLRAAGLSQVDADLVLGDVDAHRGSRAS